MSRTGPLTRPPHPATVVHPKQSLEGVAQRPPHSATEVQRAPHPATVAQPKSPHRATVGQRPTAHPATVAQTARGWPPCSESRKPQGGTQPAQRAAIPSVTFTTSNGPINNEAKHDFAKVRFCRARVMEAHRANYFVPFHPKKKLDAQRLLQDIASSSENYNNIDDPDVAGLIEATKEILTSDTTVGRFKMRPKQFLEELESRYPNWKSAFRDVNGPEFDPTTFLGPLHRLEDWREYYLREGKKSKKHFSVMVNANWFYVRKNAGVIGFPYLFPLT